MGIVDKFGTDGKIQLAELLVNSSFAQYMHSGTVPIVTHTSAARADKLKCFFPHFLTRTESTSAHFNTENGLSNLVHAGTSYQLGICSRKATKIRKVGRTQQHITNETAVKREKRICSRIELFSVFPAPEYAEIQNAESVHCSRNFRGQGQPFSRKKKN